MFASIDIGTNTIRCLISKSKDSVLSPEFVDMKIIRLGENFSREKVISKTAVQRLKTAISEYLEKIKSYNINISSVIVSGTSILRDAPNSKEVIDGIYDSFGLKIAVISGEKEADITLSGIASCFKNFKNFYAVDIGGGSTEYSCVKGGNAAWKYSLNMGVVHLTEKFIKSDPASILDISLMEGNIDESLNSLKREILKSGYSFEKLDMVGTAGTATTLAMVDKGIHNYDRLKVHGYILKKEKIMDIYKLFEQKSSKERLQIAGVEPGREDLVLAGTAIMLKSMDFFESDSFIVSECGLLEGLLGNSHI